MPDEGRDAAGPAVRRHGIAHLDCRGGERAVGTIVVLLLVVAVNADVVARGVFSAPFSGTVEVVQFSMVLIVFLQLARRGAGRSADPVGRVPDRAGRSPTCGSGGCWRGSSTAVSAADDGADRHRHVAGVHDRLGA